MHLRSGCILLVLFTSSDVAVGVSVEQRSEDSGASDTTGFNKLVRRESSAGLASLKDDEKSEQSEKTIDVVNDANRGEKPATASSFVDTAMPSQNKLGVAASVKQAIHSSYRMAASVVTTVRKANPVAQMGGWILSLVLTVGWAVKYKSDVVDHVPRLSGQPLPTKSMDFQRGMFDCCSESHICCNICCCSCTRNAHTWESAGLMDFWTSVLFQMFCCPFSCCIGVYMRMQMRKSMGVEDNAMMDVCVFCCGCGACASGQEALEIDRVTGVTYSMPFNVDTHPPVLHVLPPPNRANYHPPPKQQTMKGTPHFQQAALFSDPSAGLVQNAAPPAAAPPAASPPPS